MTGVMTGSCNVITLNINRIVQDWALTHTLNGTPLIKGKKLIDNPLRVTVIENDLKNYVTRILERVYKYHIAFKTMLYDLEDKGMFAASNGGYIHISKLYSTIGINGLNEAARFLGMKVSNNPEYIEFLQLIWVLLKNKISCIPSMTENDLSCLIQKLCQQKDWEERIINGIKKMDMLFQR